CPLLGSGLFRCSFFCSLLCRLGGLLRRRPLRFLGLLRRLLGSLLRGFLCHQEFLLFCFLTLALLRFRHRDPPVAAHPSIRRFVSSAALKRAALIDQFDGGRGPPVAQSRSSIVCTTGTDVPPAICTMHPILPAAIMSGLTLAMLAILRSRNLVAMSGWRRL